MNQLKNKVFNAINENKVVMLFIILCAAATYASKNPLTFVSAELFTRIGRNGFMVLALLIPVLAGMGLNFGITIGAIAAQIAVFWIVYWGYTGITGFLLSVVMATPIAMIFGWMVGKLFNKMKGSEMIAGMVLGYFADGLYQLFFLYIIGGIIPVQNDTLIITGGIGVKNTIDLANNLKYSLDTVSMLKVIEITFYVVVAITLFKILFNKIQKTGSSIKKDFVLLGIAALAYAATFIPAVEGFLGKDRLLLLHGVTIAVVFVVALQVFRIIHRKFVRKDPEYNMNQGISKIITAIICYGLTYIKPIEKILLYVNIPVTTYLCIAALCVFNNMLLRTRLGQNMRTVGQSRAVANAAGIDVDRTRIIAMILSTVLACWGQLIYLQNIGTFSTYGAHTQVAQFAIAALLVGGASVQKATNKQAIIGVILFHTLFIVAPQAGKELFNNAQLGEYFRVFVAYGVIAVSLAMHAWKTTAKPTERGSNSKGLFAIIKPFTSSMK
ncbi:ABC transporter permease subunit [Alkaliphilus oremlandii]|uniref:Inner-membrane translocator n=1 Tax=Alkaliphilus oremlandii (strain OhILAs) TaxID=350688 RepID=A8MM24_ALKOO|nr:ABC transporter permease [Alkaliphilus oremlandii]ABW18191.1 inner-membrane translocator [Alkaliphilus oremlandii OhILAs]